MNKYHIRNVGMGGDIASWGLGIEIVALQCWDRKKRGRCVR